MKTWREVWRDGLAPVLSTTGLGALRNGLKGDDQRIMQGATASPPPLQCVADWPVEAACVIGSSGTATVCRRLPTSRTISRGPVSRLTGDLTNGARAGGS
jgi:hypothetical protein